MPPYSFSIILATCGRPRQLRACLRSIADMRLSGQTCEVVVVDDGGKSDAATISSALSDRLDLQCVTIDRSGCGIARNAGAAKASGRFLVFTDDDCRPSRHWLRALHQVFSIHPESLVAGKTINGLTENIYSTASQLLIQFLCEYYNREPENGRFANGSNMALARTAFWELGGFDSKFSHLCGGEDTDFCHRWLGEQRKIVYAPDVLVHHYHELDFIRFVRQHYRYGRGAGVRRQLNKKRNESLATLEPLRFYWGMMRKPFSCTNDRRSLLLSGLMVISQAAYLLGYLITKRKTRDQ